MSEVTQILFAIEQGDGRAAVELLPLVYDELRRLAAETMGQERPGQTLQATALVHRDEQLRRHGRRGASLFEYDPSHPNGGQLYDVAAPIQSCLDTLGVGVFAGVMDINDAWEVEAAARLSHANIVTANDADEAKGVHFLVMEYVEGRDLNAFVRERGTLSVARAVDCILQAAKSLECAHSQGIIHRDVKPHNLLLDDKGTVKILDMGLARIEHVVAGADVVSDSTTCTAMSASGVLIGAALPITRTLRRTPRLVPVPGSFA